MANNIKTELDFENTKHRYPWICSLRSKREDKQHYCAVTLLRRPPGPTVLVTNAHCTYLCKSSDNQVVPNCCCDNVSDRIGCSFNETCGIYLRVLGLAGNYVQVVCGEWEIGSNAYVSSGERYNLILTIKVCKQH